MGDSDEKDFEVIDESGPIKDWLVTNKYVTSCTVNIITKQHPVSKVTHIHREILSIHRQYYRDRNKYELPHQNKREMERRANG